jgi:hypothetical protein
MTAFVPRLLSLLLILSIGATPALAQESGAEGEEENCPAQPLEMADAGTSGDADPSASAGTTASADSAASAYGTVSVNARTPATKVEPATEAERRVQDLIAEDGIHVVHFWAPWCPNSKNELGYGWSGLVEDNPNVTFTFVTVWNDAEPGASVLERYDIPDRVTELTQPDLGPSSDESQRRQAFLGMPVTWIPSTWIFHNNGELAFALNYGEMKMDTIQSLLDATRKDW